MNEAALDRVVSAMASQCLFGEEALMRGDDDVGEGEQSCRGGMLQDLIGTILENVRGFFLVNIQADAEELVGANSENQVIGTDQAAAGRC